MDKATANAERLAYARCFIKVSAARPLPKTISVQVEEWEEVEIEVAYEWIPPVCMKCCFFGHVNYQCPTKPKWIPTANTKSYKMELQNLTQVNKHPKSRMEKQTLTWRMLTKSLTIVVRK